MPNDTNDGGKGDSPRPIVVTRKEYDDNWAKTFNNNKLTPKQKEN
jgi:hypothetical protein